MKQHELVPSDGANHARKRVGRGHGSGWVKTAGRGSKGQKSRTGHHSMPAHFAGGQVSMAVHMPHRRGFANIFSERYEIVNVGRLDVFEAGSLIGPEVMASVGLVDKDYERVKILGVGEITRPLNVTAHKFSASAKAKIESAGGTATEVEEGA